MTTNLKLDLNGDLAIENGNISLLTDKDALLQRIKCELATFKGEYFLDDNVGIPYFQQVFVKNPNFGLLNAIFANKLRSIEGVDSVTSLQFKPNASTRTLAILFAIKSEGQTISGTVEV